MKRFLSIILSAVICVVSICFNGSFAVSAEISVSAKACVLIETGTGRILYSKNSDTKLPMASTTKIMTTLLCLESGSLDENFVVDSEAIKVEGSSMGLVEGDVVTKRALCCGMLLPSGNDAANATAIKLAGSFEAFADMMNERAEEIGMTRTNFVTPSGLEGEGHGSSAYDMALLTREALKNEDFRAICSQSSMKVSFGNPPCEKWLTNTNKLLTMYDGVIGVKTGFTDEAGRCLVSACEKNGVTLICVTLNDPNDWQDHINLYNYGYSKATPYRLKQTQEINIPVVGSDKDMVKAQSDESLTFGTSDGAENQITTKVVSEPFLYAPVNMGDTIGKLEFYYNDKLVGSINLKAVETAEFIKPDDTSKSSDNNIAKRLWNKIKGLFN